MSEVYQKIVFVFLIFLFQNSTCFIDNPAVGILGESNIYFAQIREFNYSKDDCQVIYHHDDPVYSLQSLTTNNLIQRIYICSPNIIYTLDLRTESVAIPISPVDDTPCRLGLVYLPGKATLVWAFRHTLIQLDFQDMSKEHIWNSTSTILDVLYNGTVYDDNDDFYISVAMSDRQSAVLNCRINRTTHISSIPNCYFIDTGYQQVSALAIDGNRLYVADRILHEIYELILLPNHFILAKNLLPLNRSVVADIQAMFTYNNYLVWISRSGHVRIVSLNTYEMRNLFWIDEPLRTVRLVSFVHWPNHTTIATTTTATTTTTTTVRTTMTTTSTAQMTTSMNRSTTKTTETNDNTSAMNDYNHNPWKATTIVTSIILGIALFLCATMITCVLLNYRLGRVVPHSFTNIFHILRSRPSTIQRDPLSEDSLT